MGKQGSGRQIYVHVFSTTENERKLLAIVVQFVHCTRAALTFSPNIPPNRDKYPGTGFSTKGKSGRVAARSVDLVSAYFSGALALFEKLRFKLITITNLALHCTKHYSPSWGNLCCEGV